MFLKIITYDADVLILGAGGAGAMAAIKAHKEGVDLLLVSKDEFPSGCTTIAMGAIQAAFDPEDSREKHFEDTLRGGAYLNNPTLVKVLVDEALERVMDLENFGTCFRKDKGNYMLFPITGCTYPRAFVTIKPYEGTFIEGLVREVRRRKIKVVKNVMVTNFLKEDHEIIGAVGVNLRTGEFVVFNAKSTVLASGGAGRLYPLTTNPPGVTGDGYAMAYRAGVELLDMEFVQSRACIIEPQALGGQPPPLDGLVTVGGRFYNTFGERYMKKYYPKEAEKVTRDAIAICTFKEIKAGKGTANGGVYNDLSGVPEDELRRFEKFIRICNAEGIDPTWQPLEWAPGVHHFIGGLRINERCETNIPGLFAAGEVTGGIHGGNRVGGNALTDTLVFGVRAGRSAATRASSIEDPKIPTRLIEGERNKILEIYERKSGMDALEEREKMRRVMANYVGVVRTGSELEKAIVELEKIKDNLTALCLPEEKTFKQLRSALESLNLVDVGLMVARAALMRQESRGAHYREDYPQRDDENWCKNIVISLEKGRMSLRTSPLNRTN